MASRCLAAAAAISLSLVGCGHSPDTAVTQLPAGRAGLVAWRSARARVQALRQKLTASKPYSMNVTLVLQQQQLGQRMRARGAVAVLPPHALRMILLGPGGTTALDLWVCGDEFRFSVPAIDLERRGDERTPRSQLRGLPVDFLSWWFLRPLGGTLLSYDSAPDARRYLLRDGRHIVDLLEQPDERLRIRRASLDDAEALDVAGAPCGHVHYRQQSTGIDIEVQCEKLNRGAPPKRAFADPDDPTRPCAWEAT